MMRDPNIVMRDTGADARAPGSVAGPPQQLSLRCWIMRGGTSKAVFLREEDVPDDQLQRRRLILKIFGSPDRRQIDGLGGADPLTSKCAVVGRSSRSDANVECAFYQVGIDTDAVKPSICGNISAAVGPFAIDTGLVEPREPVTTVAIYNPHTDRVIYAEVPVAGGKSVTHGDCRIAGVPGSGARILLDWRNVVGIETGGLLPTGNARDRFSLPGVGEVEVSIVDCGNPVAFIDAGAFGLPEALLPDAANADAGLLARAELLRGAVAKRIGLVDDAGRSAEQNPNHPFLAFVAPPAGYLTASGKRLQAGDIDVISRAMFMQRMHRAYPASGALSTGVAARIPGTVVHAAARARSAPDGVFRIGHPDGVMEVEVDVDLSGPQMKVRRAAFARTARLIMEGTVYVEL